eukprot:829623-Karenia_brevis.AAC.1
MGLDTLPAHITIPCIYDLYHMHDGVDRAHDPGVPPYAFGYCNCSDWASAVFFAGRSICTHGPDL